MFWVSLLAPLLMSACLTRFFISPKSGFHIIDHPNERSLHEVPTPRAGGIAIMIAFFVVASVTVVVMEDSISPVVLGGALLIALVSFIDDLYSLSAGSRFIIHICAAIAVVLNGFQIDSLQLPGWEWHWPGLLAAGLSVLFIVWLTNLYNFMDGMDGFAGGMAVVGFSCFALIGWHQEHQSFMVSNLIVVGAVAGFLVFNFPPARIFMGDTGSSTLGFLVALFSIWASIDDIFPLWIAVLVFSPFIVDSSVTLVRRLVAGERVWKAHKSHYYQRLVQLGWGHKQTVLSEYVVMVLCGISALIATDVGIISQVSILVAWVIVYILILVGVSRLERRMMYNR